MRNVAESMLEKYELWKQCTCVPVPGSSTFYEPLTILAPVLHYLGRDNLCIRGD